MKRILTKPLLTAPQVEIGSFSKKEAAQKIAAGCRHIHSSPIGKRDPGFKSTLTSLKLDAPKPYAWEQAIPSIEVFVASSSDRHRIIQTLGETLLGEGRKGLRQKAEGVLEELITNAIYHAYRDPKGAEKYARQKSVKLLDSEAVKLRCRTDDNGLFIGISDSGGHLVFEDIRQAFQRCYASAAEIEAKSGGAGLGMYMIFESVTHLKIRSVPGEFTEVCCWIADHKTHDPSVFSFNFFEGKSDDK